MIPDQHKPVLIVGAQVIAGTHAMHDIIMAHGHGVDDRIQLTRKEGWLRMPKGNLPNAMAKSIAASYC